MELLAIGLDILDPGLDGLEAGKLVNDQAIGVGRLADVDPDLLAVAQGDALAAVALDRPHDLGYDLAVLGLRVVDGGANDHIDGHAPCLLLDVCDALDHDLPELGDLLGLDFSRLAKEYLPLGYDVTVGLNEITTAKTALRRYRSAFASFRSIERFSEPAVYGSQQVARLHQEGSESRYRIERFSNVSEESEFVSAIADVLLRKTIQVTCRITVPSEMFGGETPVLAAFFAIQSRATRTLSSVPALSVNTDTEKPPSAVRTSEKLTNPFTARIRRSTSPLFFSRMSNSSFAPFPEYVLTTACIRVLHCSS